MGNATIIVGVSIVTFLVAYIMFKINQAGREQGEKGDSHGLLQVFMFFFIIFNLIIIAKVALDDADMCAWNVANSTTTGSLVEYEYEYQCETNTHNTAVTFYKAVMGFIIAVAAYVFIFYGKKIFDWMINTLGLK